MKFLPLADKKALEAAARLGDRDALEELAEMQERTFYACMGVLVAALLGALIFFGFQECRASQEEDAELVRRQLELKRVFVERCALPPDLNVELSK